MSPLPAMPRLPARAPARSAPPHRRRFRARAMRPVAAPAVPGSARRRAAAARSATGAGLRSACPAHRLSLRAAAGAAHRRLPTGMDCACASPAIASETQFASSNRWMAIFLLSVPWSSRCRCEALSDVFRSVPSRLRRTRRRWTMRCACASPMFSAWNRPSVLTPTLSVVWARMSCPSSVFWMTSPPLPAPWNTLPAPDLHQLGLVELCQFLRLRGGHVADVGNADAQRGDELRR